MKRPLLYAGLALLMVSGCGRKSENPSTAPAEYTFQIPPGKINALRIDPTDATNASILLSQLYLECDDRRIDVPPVLKSFQAVRMDSVRTTPEGTVFQGVGDNAPWFAPWSFRNLDLSACKQIRLVLRMKVDRGTNVRVYWDLGDGYSSKNMTQQPLQPSKQV